jgi:hypothetical protein
MSESEKKVPSSDVIKAEVPLVEKIIRDETWYEGERRGTYVDPSDTRVQARVVDVVEKCADRIRKEAFEKAIEKIVSEEKPPAAK